MAPEQWRGRTQGPAADQYALAVMTYEMLAGHLPFDTTDMSVLREVVLNEAPEPVAFLPKHAQAALEHALSKDPAKRFRTCSGFIAALEGKPAESAAPAASMSGMNGRPDMRFASAYDSTPGGNTNLVKRIAVLMEQKEWEKAASYCEKLLESEPENPELYLLMTMISLRIASEDTLKESGLDLTADKNFQMALKFASPGRRRELETLQRDSLVNLHLKKCLQSNRVSDLAQLADQGADLKNDNDFQAILKLVPPDRRKELEDIQLKALICFHTKKSLLTNQVSDLARLAERGADLKNDKNFQALLNLVSPDRRKELEDIQLKARIRFHERQCLQTYHVSDLARLADHAADLKNDNDFQTLLSLVSPDRKKELEEIQKKALIQFHLKKCLDTYQVTGLHALADHGADLKNDNDFQVLLKLVSPDRRKELEEVQHEALINFHLKKALQANHVSDLQQLASRGADLKNDHNFRTLLTLVSPDRRKELEEVQHEALINFHLRKCLNACQVSDLSQLAKHGADLKNDADFQTALTLVSPDRRKELEDVQQMALVYFHLWNCARANSISDIGLLCHCDKPLCNDANFQAALDAAPPEQKQKILQIVYDQVNYCLACLELEYSVDAPIAVPAPLNELPLFQLALKCAPPQRRSELEAIPPRQYEYFIGKCMEGRKVSSEADLSQTDPPPLYKDNFFQTALKFATPEQQKELQTIRYEQGEFFLRKFMKAYHVPSEAELTSCPEPLFKNELFNLALQTVSPERREQLKLLPEAQFGVFLRRCLDAHRVKNASDLVKSRTPLAEDKDFLLALAFALPDQEKELKRLIERQKEWKAAKKRKRLLFFVYVVIVLIVAYKVTDMEKLRANLGDSHAQYLLAMRYQNDSYEKAMKWYLKSANNGYTLAQNRLGSFYEFGRLGVKQDYAEAAKWYRKALEGGGIEEYWSKSSLERIERKMKAQNGDANAQFELGTAFEYGDDLYKSMQEAAEWYRKAADRGHAEAQYRLGRIYENGDGVSMDLSQATEWYRKAADRGHAEAEQALKTAEMKMKAQNGDATAQYELGMAFENGDGVKQDDSKALEWLGRAAAQGHTEATAVLEGKGVKAIDLPGGLVMYVVKVKAGAFRMNALDGENESNEVPHTALLTQDFYLGQMEVTAEQWKAVTGSPFGRGSGKEPVAEISWSSAMGFCDKLNEMGKAPEGWIFTLPTETHWEYAARGGNKSKGYQYSGSNDADEVAWYSQDKVHPVGQNKPNELGLYDMSGNVREWCLDDYIENSSMLTMPEFTRNDRPGAGESAIRLATRGGSYYAPNSSFCRLSARSFCSSTGSGYHDLGFRVALVPEKY
ncbi:MAG: SEL1-like repeat protein, partial [Lachnospiraceae bacterium]|nr:SEL1-like repeat protein [Lachnospiraceae bacterium]